MKFKSIKNSSELILQGVTFQVEKLDNKLSSVILTDTQGNTVKFAQSGYYDFNAYVPDVEKAKKFELAFELEMVGKSSEQFDDEYAAKDKLEGLRNRYGCQLTSAKIAEVEVEIPF